MGRTVRFAFLVAVTVSLVAVRGLCADGDLRPAHNPAGYDPAGIDDVEREILAKKQELADKQKAEVADFRKKQEEAFAAAAKRDKDGITVALVDREVKVTEPGRENEVEAVSVERFRTWSLRPEDFRFDLPTEFYVRQAVGPERIIGKDQVFLVLPFTVANSLLRYDVFDQDGRLIESAAVSSEGELAARRAKVEQDGNRLESKPADAELDLRFALVTDKGTFTPEISGFLAHEAVEYSTFVRRAWTQDLMDFAGRSEVTGALKPGEVRAGVAVFPRFDPAITNLRVLVEGLTNERDYKRDLRKVLVLEFVRPGNIYYPNQVRMAYKRRVGSELMDPKSNYLPSRDMDVHHGFDWGWLWTWAEAAATDEPRRVEDVPSPTGDGKMNFWLYKVKMPNRTGTEQELTVDLVKTLVSVDIELAMQSADGKGTENRKFTVDVPLVDDGKMNVYKAALFDQEAVPIGERFPSNRKVEVNAESPVEFLVTFREADFDLDAVVLAIHNRLDLDLALARAKTSGSKQDPFAKPRQLTVEEVESVRKQLVEKVPAALKEQLAKTVRAEITAKSGLSSGTQTLNYSLFKPTVPRAIPEE